MSDCECYEAEPWEWSIDTWHVARKEHICCECKETIKPGEKYERIAAFGNGEFQTFKTCEFCAKEYTRLCGIICVPKGELACAIKCEQDGTL